MKTKRTVVALGVVLVGLIGAWLLLGFSRVDFGEAPADFAAEDRLDALLGEAVRDRLVDYEAVRGFGDGSGVNQLAAFYARSQPQDGDARLAAAINAYNVTVLALVARENPRGSVHEIRGVIEPKSGFGFFYALWFKFAGSWTNLYDLENDVIRSFGDARVHAAINCASASCPALYEQAFRAEGLDAQLDEVSRRFVSDPRHVRYDGAGVLHVSAIFEWFAADFEAHESASGEGGVRAFIREHCESPTCEAPAEATLRFNEYDWLLNATR